MAFGDVVRELVRGCPERDDEGQVEEQLERVSRCGDPRPGRVR
jgi:hypothetical protein